MQQAGDAALERGVGQLYAPELIDPRVLGHVPDESGTKRMPPLARAVIRLREGLGIKGTAPTPGVKHQFLMTPATEIFDAKLGDSTWGSRN